ncbi:hypothetical protein K1719_024604 [Acacia pycnantha]|nr:hypothetical protein K1719_024604 [Acacia pycnantha]
MIFCSAFCGATIVVILLALLSPNASKTLKKSHTRPLLDLSLYIQKPHLSSSSSASSNTHSPPFGYDNAAVAFIFHRLLTEGPENNSRVVGKAQGFIFPPNNFHNCHYSM